MLIWAILLFGTLSVLTFQDQLGNLLRRLTLPGALSLPKGHVSASPVSARLSRGG